MSEILTLVAVAAAAFLATNLDNLLLLVSLFARYESQARRVAAGYFAAMLTIGAISLTIGKAAELVPVNYLGLLGSIPLVMGVMALFKLFRGTDSADATREIGPAALAATFSTQLSNGSDTIATFSILFGDSTNIADYVISLTFVGMLCVFAMAAFYALRHRWLSQTIGRYGRYVTPFILIAVGLYVLSNTASDMAPG
jgi:cadmium resistance protein CadD (predicted permease)